MFLNLYSKDLQSRQIRKSKRFKFISQISELDASKFNEELDIDDDYSSKMNDSKYDPTKFESCEIPTGHSLAIIIPFRDDGSSVRTNQFKVLLHYMIPVLVRQNVKFQFFRGTCVLAP